MNRNLNGSAITFEQDDLIIFDEQTHTYTTVSGDKLTSVSNVVGLFFKPFDAEYWSMRKCNGDAAAAAEMRESWEMKGNIATQAGTFLHKQIEDYLNGNEGVSLDCRVRFDGKYHSADDIINISREWDYFRNFDADTEYCPFRTEWRVFDTDAGIAGTMDLICACSDGTYEIYDWKRSSKIDPDEFNRWSSGLNGLEHLTDTPYIHYCLQQNLYRYILEKNYGLRISRMNLVVLCADNANYRIVPVPRMTAEVNTILQYLKNHK